MGACAAYVYGLVDPRNGELRYIGISKNPAKRLQYHCEEARSKKQTMKARWIHGIVSAGSVPDMFIIEECDLSSWAEAERHWIAYFRFLGANLLNATDGGEGTPSFTHSAETKAKISASNKGRVISDGHRKVLRERVTTKEERARISAALKGRGPDAETAKKISATMRGRQLSEAVKEKISAAHRGKKLSTEHVQKISEAMRSKDPQCKRGRDRTPGEPCRLCGNLNAAAYRARKRGE